MLHIFLTHTLFTFLDSGENERFAIATTPTKEKNVLNKEIDKQYT